MGLLTKHGRAVVLKPSFSLVFGFTCLEQTSFVSRTAQPTVIADAQEVGE